MKYYATYSKSGQWLQMRHSGKQLNIQFTDKLSLAFLKTFKIQVILAILDVFIVLFDFHELELFIHVITETDLHL